MTIKKYLPILIVLIVSLLAACGPGKSDIVGRWEYFSNEDHSAGVVYEFSADGTCLYYEFSSSSEFLYPAINERSLIDYSVSLGTLEIKQKGGEYYSAETGIAAVGDTSFEMTFVSEDELLLVPEGQTEGRTFQRVPLPEMPLEARLALGSKLQRGDTTVISVERLVGDWQEKYPDYMETDSTHFLAVTDPEQWAVVVQVEGRADPLILILVEGEKWWGVIRLELPG